MKLALYVVSGFIMVLLALVALAPGPDSNPAVLFAVVVVFSIAPLGAFWMMYKVVRCERNPVPLILLSFLPFTFVWYYFERARSGKVKEVRDSIVVSDQGERSLYRSNRFIKAALLTIVAVVVFAFAFWVIVTPGDPRRVAWFVPVSIAVFVVPPIGAWWLVYMVIRKESRVFPMILLAFVPYGFIWYYFERVRGGNDKLA